MDLDEAIEAYEEEERQQEVDEIQRLEDRVKELEVQITREIDHDTPHLGNPEEPTIEEREAHELTHATYKS